MLLCLLLMFLQRQKLVQGANGVEVAVVDGKGDIENGNVPEDKPSEEEDGDLTSPFSVPSKRDTEKRIWVTVWFLYEAEVVIAMVTWGYLSVLDIWIRPLMKAFKTF